MENGLSMTPLRAARIQFIVMHVWWSRYPRWVQHTHLLHHTHTHAYSPHWFPFPSVWLPAEPSLDSPGTVSHITLPCSRFIPIIHTTCIVWFMSCITCLFVACHECLAWSVLLVAPANRAIEHQPLMTSWLVPRRHTELENRTKPLLN